MTLRARLLLSTAGLLALALLATGVLLVGFTRASLVDQVDLELRTAGLQDLRPGGPGSGEGQTGRRVALLLLDDPGAVLDAVPSGFASNPDPLPVLPTYEGGIPAAEFRRIQTRASEDGSVSYRVLLARGPRQATFAVAAPLTGVETAVRSLVRNLLGVGALAIAGVVVVGWVLIRRDLRPLERIATAADAIAAGDLSHRAGVPHDRSEVGRLGTAFDRMLDEIQRSFEEQRAALEAKDASERRLRQFVADASHELRTPLTAVRGYADLFRAGGLDEDAALEAAMGRIGTESRRMGSLVEDLLLLARLDQGRPLRRDPVDLSALVEDAVADARALEPGRPILASVAPGVRIVGDEDRLRQVVGNLLANVRVHTPPDAEVAVTLSTDAAGVEVRVADRGPGIDPVHAARVFDRFYRADPGRSRDRGGSGLGLSIAASVGEAHGGSLHFEATPGGGATFVLRLPAAPPTGAGTTPRA